MNFLLWGVAALVAVYVIGLVAASFVIALPTWGSNTEE